MAWTWNRILGTFIPILVATLTILAAWVPTIRHFKARKHRKGDMAFVHVESGTGYFQAIDKHPDFLIVGSVNSNNDSPCLAETLSGLLEHMGDLGMELNIAPRGCATVG